MILQDEARSNADPTKSDLFQTLELDSEVREALALAISERIIKRAEEIGEMARHQMEHVDWVAEILRAVENKGVSEKLTDSFGSFGDCVGLRLQLAITKYSQEISEIKKNHEELLEIEEEAKKTTLEKRWEIRRNSHLTRIEWALTILSVWPIIIIIVVSMTIGTVIGYFSCLNSRSCYPLQFQSNKP